MKTKLFTMIAAVGALATLATGCDKPDTTPACLIGRGIWVATYTKVDDNANADCVDRPGDLLNLDKYQAFPEQGQPVPTASLAIKPVSYRYSRLQAADLPTPSTDAATRTDVALGQFQSNNATDGICTVPTLSAAALTTKPGGVIDADTTISGLPSSWKFSNVQFQNDGTHGGHQMKGELELGVGGCVAHYTFSGIYENNVFLAGPQPCTQQADCDPHADAHDLTRLIPQNGSGIDPDFPVFCDTNVGQFTGYGLLSLGAASVDLGDGRGDVPIGVCNLDGPFGTVCDSTQNPNCWKSGPQGSAANP